MIIQIMNLCDQTSCTALKQKTLNCMIVVELIQAHGRWNHQIKSKRSIIVERDGRGTDYEHRAHCVLVCVDDQNLHNLLKVRTYPDLRVS